MVRICAIVAGLAVGLAACGASATPSPAASGAGPSPAASTSNEPTAHPTPTAQAPTPFVEYQDPADLAVGDCYDAIEDEESDLFLAAAIRSCEEPHLHEVFAIVELENPIGAPFPNDRDLENASVDLCDPAFEEYVGTPIDDSRYDYLYYMPSDVTWENGDREVMCVVDDRGDRIVGSVKGTGGD